MLRLMKLKYFVPVHGEYRMQKVQEPLQLAGSKENSFILSNSDVLAVTADSARRAGHFLRAMYMSTEMVSEISKHRSSDRSDTLTRWSLSSVLLLSIMKTVSWLGPDMLSLVGLST